MIYKIIYHQGDNVDVKTEVASGFATLTDTDLQIVGDENIHIQFADLEAVELFRLHGSGRMIKITHRDGTIFLSVIRFRLIRLPIIGQFATVNYFRTGELLKLLQSKASTNMVS
jgi:hypothetical protein